VRLADELHDTASVSDALWVQLAEHWDDAQLIELIATAGFYHLVSFIANAAGVQPEPYAERFPREP
jgi:alkylhydroperoxidase family enzyme